MKKGSVRFMRKEKVECADFDGILKLRFVT